ncbi:MAG TPA: HAMP domain-containing sensor histidine kinase [Terriglobales bacterium]|nr:HAMP domain-containing sensor histidine kinase [Terriglobales bacterium]
MNDTFARLPTVILLGVLVAIFAALLKQNRTFRFRLWFVGWAILFIRFVLQLIWRPLGFSPGIYGGIDLASLQVAGIIFLGSVSALADTTRRNLYFILISLPLVIYAFCLSLSVEALWVYVAILSLIAVVPSTIVLRYAGVSRWNVGLLSTGWVTLIWSFWEAYYGRPELGFYAFMTWVYAACAVLFYRRYRRLTPGIVTTSLGFLGWAAISPLGHFLHYLPMNAAMQNSMWNLPKFVVAIGMIVTLLEDERISAEDAHEREQMMSEQMRRFADLTSQLFSGGDVREVCGQIAKAITETSNFLRAVIVLAEGPNRYVITGHAGFSEAAWQQVSGCVAALTDESFLGLARPDSRIGTNSYRAKSDYSVMNILPMACNAPWSDGHKVVIPMGSPGRGVIGAMGLDEPRSLKHVSAENLASLELLATDVAGALDNSKLQRQLFHSEKLAGMGQLVSGVAHELNNPLTAILGYSEILGDRAIDSAMKRDLDVMRREALRMKRIIENLQRFSRQQRMEKKVIGLKPLLEDVLKLRAYDMHALNIRVTQDIQAQPLLVFADETLLHQVLMNVLNNAMDAVEHLDDKRISIAARVQGDRAHISIHDNGPGFAEVARVFDPFYTTKGPGKGTGLGLSICYGIIREHGGDIIATNLAPQGASITILLPLQVERAERSPVASDKLADI